MKSEPPIVQLEEIAQDYGLTPHYLRKIAYLSFSGYKQNQIHKQTGIAEDVITRYRRQQRKMTDQETRKLLNLVAELEGV